jgi:hypothetical protein
MYQDIQNQGCKNAGRQVAKAKKFCTRFRNVCGFSVGKMSTFWRSEFFGRSVHTISLRWTGTKYNRNTAANQVFLLSFFKTKKENYIIFIETTHLCY